MKSNMLNGSFQPKKVLALALLAVATLMPASKVSAESLEQGHYQTVLSPAAIVCDVSGVDYPVDGLGRIWAADAYGRQFVIGHIVYGPIGPIAVRNDGWRFPAVCQ
jgi:hypothetical protein